ncbi:2-nitropropane dioxygenase [Algimonas ampicilliniresistens]|uniref:2-nitropropane dioxygenase n=1 Tax=Algimonas ampicilliniresistens TaxID=1298735 RepID=A0ABQ5VCM8_9PROT|nr:nitronate monooxygenase [Algimonas ampicilliniresistens]GLQ25153.1 2-nitropropane dioxygenase [Algimonas ampicilliniresistens]
MTPDHLLSLRLPVMVAPMFLVSGPEMVIASARSGVIGAFPTPNCRTGEQLDDWMTQIVAETKDAPGLWAANLVTHRTNTRLADDLALVAKHKPPVVITALGSPAPAISVVHGYGGIVLADITSPTLGLKAAAAGADGLVAVSSGAGGHTGTLSPFAFISELRSMFDGLICVGGAISDGAGVAGAVAAGADIVYMGTRFLAAEESLAVPDYKRMVVDAQLTDIVVSDIVTGTAASWLRPSLEANGYDLSGEAKAVTRNYGGPDVGKRWKDVWAAGQGVGAIEASEPVAKITDQIEQEFKAAQKRLAAYGGSS